MTQELDLPLGPPPRKAHVLRAARNIRRAYGMLFALVILVFGGWAALDALRWCALTYEVRRAAGTVTKKQTMARHAASEYRVEYAFTTDDGTRIHDATAVTPAVYEALAEGGACPVVYLPEQAAVDHWLFDNDASRAHVMYLGIGHGLAAFLAVVVLRLVDHPLRRELRLARRGQVVDGQIVTIGKTRGRRAAPTIAYTFRTGAGAIVEGGCLLPRRVPAETLAPGMKIAVLYDPKNPRINKPRLALEYVEFGAAGKKKSV